MGSSLCVLFNVFILDVLNWRRLGWQRVILRGHLVKGRERRDACRPYAMSIVTPDSINLD